MQHCGAVVVVSTFWLCLGSVCHPCGICVHFVERILFVYCMFVALLYLVMLVEVCCVHASCGWSCRDAS